MTKLSKNIFKNSDNKNKDAKYLDKNKFEKETSKKLKFDNKPDIKEFLNNLYEKEQKDRL